MGGQHNSGEEASVPSHAPLEGSAALLLCSSHQLLFFRRRLVQDEMSLMSGLSAMRGLHVFISDVRNAATKEEEVGALLVVRVPEPPPPD